MLCHKDQAPSPSGGLPKRVRYLAIIGTLFWLLEVVRLFSGAAPFCRVHKKGPQPANCPHPMYA
jgi:hypothetical protein